jgi:threonine synthase
MNFSLRCHLCGTGFPPTAVWVCDQCLGPLEVTYDYPAIAKLVTRELIEARPKSLWRYREFLPIEGEPLTGLHSGFTPLVRARRLGERLGIRELYVKDDSVNHPTCSYKDRVVSVAATRAVELGFTVFACASTGNLANSVAAHAARLGLSCSVFIPDNLETGKVTGSAVYRPRIIAVRGNYDDVNRLCTQVAIATTGASRTSTCAPTTPRARRPAASRSPSSSAGGSRGTSCPRSPAARSCRGSLKGFVELVETGLVAGDLPAIHAAQAAGCAPVVRALQQGLEFPEPVKPDTLAKSIAIGNPADGFQVVRSVRSTGGAGAMVTEDEIIEGIQLLAETEGIFTEPAGGVTVASTRQLVERGAIGADEGPVVICVTGNGYKTAEVLNGRGVEPIRIGRSLAEFEAIEAAGEATVGAER